jgi:hypothetical protein
MDQQKDLVRDQQDAIEKLHGEIGTRDKVGRYKLQRVESAWCQLRSSGGGVKREWRMARYGHDSCPCAMQKSP